MTAVSDALDSLIAQYRDSPNLRAVVSSFVSRVDEALDAAASLAVVRDLDNATGDALDIIGDVVGQPRTLAGIVPLGFFQYWTGSGGPAGLGFGSVSDPSLGSRFRSINEPAAAGLTLEDPEYRAMLKAKIHRNMTSATPEDVIAAIRAVLPDAPDVIIAEGPGSAEATATVQRALSTEEQAILTSSGGPNGDVPVIPRPVGVSLTIGGL